MRNGTERTIDIEIFYQIMKNISPRSYILCTKCNATQIDAPELSEYIVKFVNQYLYSDDESGYEEIAEIMDGILDDILESASDDLNQESLPKWHLENENRLFGQRHEEGDLEYFVYDNVLFYQNVECECYLRKNIDQESIYSVRVK
jgi:hypothetical protein